MIKKCMKKFVALLSACALVLAASFPAMAGGDESYFMDMDPGDYSMTYLRFNVLNPGDELGVPSSARLYGPDVESDGAVALNQGDKYSFNYEQTMPYGYLPTYGFNSKLQIGYHPLSNSTNYYIPIDGKTMFAFPAEGTDVSVNISFNDVELESVLSIYGYGTYYGPTVQLNGKISVEVTMMVEGIFTIPEYDQQLNYETFPTHADELRSILEECATVARSGDARYGTMFSEPQELTYRIDLEGDMIGFGAEYPETALNIGFSVIGSHDYTVDFQGDTYVTTVRDGGVEDVNFNAYSMECFLTINALDWRFVLERGRDVDITDVNDSTALTHPAVTAAEAITVTVGAGAAALGGSALVSVLGEAVGSTASNMLVPTPTVIDPTVVDPTVVDPTVVDPTVVDPTVSHSTGASPAGVDPTTQTSTGSGLPEADLPANKKRQLLGDDKEDTTEPDNTEGSAPTDTTEGTSDISDADTTDLPEEATDQSEQIPDLPEEDSPEVSMTLYAPGENLLNIKGGAADITVELSGGEGYDWHFIPAIIVPGAARTIIPTVLKQGTRATLVLALTGAKLETRHSTVFVNLIAWAMTPEGKRLKTSSSMEMKLHEKGIEAKYGDDGSVTVTAYGETTLKGYAEIRELSAEEYTQEVMEDKSITIHAKDATLGTTTLKKR